MAKVKDSVGRFKSLGSGRTSFSPPVPQRKPLQTKDVGEIPQPKSISNDTDGSADFWGSVYQTTNNPTKKSKFNKDVKSLSGVAPKEQEIQGALDAVIPAFDGDEGTDSSKLRDFMYKVALHESSGGKYDRQSGGGPAQGFWQVEPQTAKDILKNSSRYLGPSAEKAMGLTKAQLGKMSTSEFREALRRPEVNLAFAIAKTLAGAKSKNKLEFLK